MFYCQTSYTPLQNAWKCDTIKQNVVYLWGHQLKYKNIWLILPCRQKQTRFWQFHLWGLKWITSSCTHTHSRKNSHFLQFLGTYVLEVILEVLTPYLKQYRLISWCHLMPQLSNWCFCYIYEFPVSILSTGGCLSWLRLSPSRKMLG